VLLLRLLLVRLLLVLSVPVVAMRLLHLFLPQLLLVRLVHMRDPAVGGRSLVARNFIWSHENEIRVARAHLMLVFSEHYSADRVWRWHVHVS
jgi:hypothetical protein